MDNIKSDFDLIIEKLKNGCHPSVAVKEAYLAGYKEGVADGVQVTHDSIVKVMADQKASGTSF